LARTPPPRPAGRYSGWNRLASVHALEDERRRPIYNDNHNYQNLRDNSGIGQLLRNIPARFFLSFPVSAADFH
jgi:hypothetical protein